HMSLSNVSVVAFHYRSYGTFCIYSKRLHNLYSGFTHYRNYRALFFVFKGQIRGKTLYSMKIKSSLGNEAEDRTGVYQGKLTTDNFDFRRVLVIL
ncbi:hypothetical protein ACTGZW_11545, partial [Streptococcus suis]